MQGGGGGGGGTDLSAVIELLKQILKEMMRQWDEGQVDGYVDFNPNGTIGTTAAQLYPAGKKVRRAIIENLSSTDNYTITSDGQAGKIATQKAAGKGIILNKAAASQGGGSITVQNIDLSEITVVSDTNTGQNIAVYYEL